MCQWKEKAWLSSDYSHTSFNLEQLAPEATELPNLALPWHPTPHSRPGWAGSHTLPSFPSPGQLQALHPSEPQHQSSPCLTRVTSRERWSQILQFSKNCRNVAWMFSLQPQYWDQKELYEKPKNRSWHFSIWLAQLHLEFKKPIYFVLGKQGTGTKQHWVPTTSSCMCTGWVPRFLIPQAHQLLLNSSALHHFLISLLVLM